MSSRGRQRTKQAPRGSFGDILYHLRKSQEMTLEELSKNAGLSRKYITRLEEGNSRPSAKVVRLLAGALDEPPLSLKVAAGLVEFWDLYRVDFKERPDDVSLSDVSEEEENKLLWFLRYIRHAEI
jgi:transcriptional regulator with XRE-family HTH domain